MRNFYDTLGVNSDSSFSDIKDAYHKLSKKFHPDINAGDPYFENRFKDIQEAYEVLSDPGSRRRYDLELERVGKYDEKSFAPKIDPLIAPPVNPAASQFKFRRSHTGLSITLVLIGLIFGVYIIKLFGSSKSRPLNNIAVAGPVFRVRKKHKVKHTFRAEGKKVIPEPVADTARKIVPVPVRSNPAMVQQAHDSLSTAGKNYLYATYVHPNVTGIVKLRQSGSYNADVIETIPGESKVLVLRRGDTYYKVNYNSVVGYVPKWSLETR